MSNEVEAISRAVKAKDFAKARQLYGVYVMKMERSKQKPKPPDYFGIPAY